MADTTKGYGSRLYYGVTFSATEVGYTEIGQTRDMAGGTPTVEEVDTSHNLSPGQVREKEADWITTENFTVNLLYRYAHHILLWNLCLNRTVVWWTLTQADGKKHRFQGFITSISKDSPLEGRLTSDVEISVTGVPLLS